MNPKHWMVLASRWYRKNGIEPGLHKGSEMYDSAVSICSLFLKEKGCSDGSSRIQAMAGYYAYTMEESAEPTVLRVKCPVCQTFSKESFESIGEVLGKIHICNCATRQGRCKFLVEDKHVHRVPGEPTNAN